MAANAGNPDEARRFQHAIVPADVCIEGRTLDPNAIEGIRISGNLTLRDCRFTAPLVWQKMLVEGEIRIEACIFEAAVRLEETVSKGNIYISDTEFLDDVHLGGTEAGKNLAIVKCTFHRYFSVRDVKVEGYTWLLNTSFFGYYNEIRCRHIRETFVEGCRFYRVSTFDEAKFTRMLSIRDSTFHHAPTFFATQFAETLEITNSNFRDLRSADAHRSYRTIRNWYLQRQARREEAVFYSLEQASLTRRQRRNVEWTLAIIYEKVSNYGTNPARVVLSMAILVGAFFAIYMWILGSWREATEFSAQQIFTPFKVWEMKDTQEVSLPVLSLGTKFLASLQSVAFLILLGIFLLAVRWRFRSE